MAATLQTGTACAPLPFFTRSYDRYPMILSQELWSDHPARPWNLYNSTCHTELFQLSHLTGLMNHASSLEVCWLMRRRKFPLFISQDGTPVHEATQQQAQSYKEVGTHSGQRAVLPHVTECMGPGYPMLW